MILIVGAGLSGLACATELHRRGIPFLLLDAAENPGGRLRTSICEGFTLDHGFQVILSSYDAVSQATDISELQPRYFEAGALMHFEGRFHHVSNPLRHPESAWEAVKSEAFSFRDKCLLLQLGAQILLTSDAALLSRCKSPLDLSTHDFLKKFGFSAEFISRFAEPFFGGVFLDVDLTTSAGLFLYYLKKFTLGRAWLPARGVAELPKHIAANLPQNSIRLQAKVESIEFNDARATGVVLINGEHIAADAIVLALDEPSLCSLLKLPAPNSVRSVAVVYFKTQSSLYNRPCLVLPQSRNSRIQHFTQMTNVAPEFAPPGWHLISASVLNFLDVSEAQLIEEVKKEIGDIFPNATKDLTHIATITVPYAVPDQPPRFAARNRFENLPKGVYASGDWSNGASIQAALTSGQQTARTLLKDLSQ